MERRNKSEELSKDKAVQRPWMVDSFAEPSVHGRLLVDKVRTNRFREAIQRTVKTGDIVVDLGAGTGLLSFFAIQAGAKHVYAIERSLSSEMASALIAANGLQDRITLISRDSTETHLPELCDVLVSETMSSFCFDYEDAIEYMADARERFLKPGGRLIPESAETFLLPFSSDAFGVGSIPQPFHGLNYLPFRKKLFEGTFLVPASREPFRELSTPSPCYTVDFRRDSHKPGRTFLPFRITSDGRLDGFLGWFTAQLCDGVSISNSPYLPMTSWGQLCFSTLEQPLVHAGQSIVLELGLSPVGDDLQWSYSVKFLNPL